MQPLRDILRYMYMNLYGNIHWLKFYNSKEIKNVKIASMVA